jgi:hypothetical protein
VERDCTSDENRSPNPVVYCGFTVGTAVAAPLAVLGMDVWDESVPEKQPEPTEADSRTDAAYQPLRFLLTSGETDEMGAAGL